jgi:hypothetical protein
LVKAERSIGTPQPAGETAPRPQTKIWFTTTSGK